MACGGARWSGRGEMHRRLPALLLLLFATGCATSSAPRSAPVKERPTASSASRRPKHAPRVERGIASYYADVLHGRRTANGERYDRNAATCAHRTHRFGTKLVVTAVKTGRRVVCRVNDRGPFVKGRVVDLSRSLAKKLGIVEQGLAEVTVEPMR